ncbi:MAG: hypothetical protein PSV36_00745 [Algoriphagus sp.]|nr:hypothetical protein [Algoriphagus sp.]
MNGVIKEGIHSEFRFQESLQSISKEGISTFSLSVMEWKSGLEISCKMEALSELSEVFTSTAEKKNAAIMPVSQLKESITNGNLFFI